MLLNILITILFVALNGFFVAAEFAIVRVRLSRLELKVHAASKRAILVKHIVSHVDRYLAATQFGITLASLGLGWIGEPVVSKIILGIMHVTGISMSASLAHDIALPLAFAVITVLHIVFGELTPKLVSIQYAEKMALATAYPLQIFYLLFKPFIWMLNGMAALVKRLLGLSADRHADFHSNDELKYLVHQGKISGAIEETDYDIIKNAFEFSERTARQVMVPRTQVVAVDIKEFNEAAVDRMIEESYSRIPCYEDNLDNTVGVVYLKDILMKMRKGDKVKIREIMRPVMVVPESKPVVKILKDFQLKHQQIAVVVNEYGGMEGIITMEDILEELVGEIQDEYDNEIPFVERISDKVYSVMASASIDDINEMLPHPIERDEQFETLAGYLILNFGRIPNVNDRGNFGKYEFTIMKKSKNLIVLVQMRDLSD